ncbi:MAG: glycosyltransferase family 39 protein [Armatimonadetes bacterium]|nr:glycosyltransferase family 39 protein [Armatimonadota bacterium]MDW8029613.1 glycosyltransferase family 39 protein [Armatimonadota bacterium]
MHRLIFLLALSLLCAVYIALLNRYGLAIPAPWPPDEIGQVSIAESWATRKVMKVSFLTNEETKQNQREIYPLLVYTASLSLWGKVFGFSISSMRWFNRLVGVLGLVLVFILARCWNMPSWLSLSVATWVAMDITYQLIGNFLRPEILCVVLMLAGLLAFTKGWESKKVFWFTVAGLFFSLSMLTHPLLGSTTKFSLLTYLCLQRQWRYFLGFSLPLLVFGLVALLYVGNLETIARQIFEFGRYLAEDKAPKSLPELLSLLLGSATLWSICDLYPSNTPVWVAILAVTLMWQRKGLFRFYGWQLIFITVAYLTVALGGHPWYFGWFTPFGYLLLGLIFSQFITAANKPSVLKPIIAVTLLWVGYQVYKVLPCWKTAPIIQNAHEGFFNELQHELPPKSKIVLFCVPDPSLLLIEKRRDLDIYLPTGTKTYQSQWEKLWHDLDGFVLVEADWVFTKPVVILPLKYRIVKRWKIPSAQITYSVVWLQVVHEKSSSGFAPDKSL